jgi:hypothetical protein
MSLTAIAVSKGTSYRSPTDRGFDAQCSNVDTVAAWSSKGRDAPSSATTWINEKSCDRWTLVRLLGICGDA